MPSFTAAIDKILGASPQVPESYNPVRLGKWTKWHPFPDPRNGEPLFAPYGPGVYQLRHKSTRKLILFGIGKNTAQRMSNILPKPLGTAGRNNPEKRNYVLEHLHDVEYRTMALTTKSAALAVERKLRAQNNHIFNT